MDSRILEELERMKKAKKLRESTLIISSKLMEGVSKSEELEPLATRSYL